VPPNAGGVEFGACLATHVGTTRGCTNAQFHALEYNVLVNTGSLGWQVSIVPPCAHSKKNEIMSHKSIVNGGLEAAGHVIGAHGDMGTIVHSHWR
jgi:hypothetical protein